MWTAAESRAAFERRMEEAFAEGARRAALLNPPVKSTANWTYDRDAAYNGMVIAKNDGLCSRFSGSKEAICLGVKFAFRNMCNDLGQTTEEGRVSSQICQGMHHAHKKGQCSDISGIGADFCYAYAMSIRAEPTFDRLTTRQTMLCNSFIDAWAEPKKAEVDDDDFY